MCEGYTVLELAIRPLHDNAAQGTDIAHFHPPATANSPELAAAIAPAAACRAHLLSLYLHDLFPTTPRFAPHIAHTTALSLPHLYAQSDLPSPLLRRAIDTLCLAHLANKTQDVWRTNLAADFLGRLLAQLRGALHLHGSTQTASPRLDGTRHAKTASTSAQSIMMTIILLSIMPKLAGDLDIPAPHDPSAIHAQAAVQFVASYGPTFLTGSPRTDVVLTRHLQLQGMGVAYARRKNFGAAHPGWQGVPGMLHEEDAMYRGSGFVVQDTPSEWLRPASPRPSSAARARTLYEDLFDPVAQLLEMVDNFSTGSGPHSQQRLDNMAAAIRHADDLQLHNITPSLQESTAKAFGPMITASSDPNDFDPGIEEHVYLVTPAAAKIIPEHYRPTADPLTANSGLRLRLRCLLVDCAILQMIDSGTSRNDLPPDWSGLHQEDIERRAYTTAREILQFVHYASRRSLTVARFLRLWISAPRHFFVSYGRAPDEVQWCDGCVAAISARIARLVAAGQGETTCPMLGTVARSIESYRYR